MATHKKATVKIDVMSNPKFNSRQVAEVRVSSRKLYPQIKVGYAEKAPKLIVGGKHTIVYEK